MMDLFFTGAAGWFSTAAVIGTAFFGIRLLLLLTGLGHHDIAVDSVDVDHGDSGDAFKVLSIQSIASFLMGFGWGGLGGFLGAQWSLQASLICAFACGVAMLYLLATLLRVIHDLSSSGNVDLTRAIGIEGDVYLTVPPPGGGSGQVRVVIGDRQRIFNAVSSGEEIPSHSRVRVLRINDDRTVTVAPLTTGATEALTGKAERS